MRLPLLALSAALLLPACSPPRISYYTLLPPAAQAAAVGGAGGIELLPVTVPAQVDMPALVVRQGGERLEPVDTRQWIAPLADEIGAALRAELRDARPARPLRLEVTVTRFESVLAQYALIEADWRLSAPRAAGSAAEEQRCHSRLQRPVGAGFEALVQGHQAALRELANQIERVAARYGPAAPACG